MPRIGTDRLVILGASIAGLVTARVLSDHYDEVLVVERDQLPDGPDHRRFVPQSHHAHGLLDSGRRVLVDLFPDLAAELEAAGALTPRTVAEMDLDMADRSIFLIRGGTTIRTPLWWSGGFCASRLLLEHAIRNRVRALPNVTILDGTGATGLLTDSSRRTVTGVTTADGPIDADLVVDATGRASSLPEWLERAGYPPPPTSYIHGDVRYASIVLEPEPAFDPEWFLILGGQATPGSTVGAVVLRVEHGRLHISFGSIAGRVALPSDYSDLCSFAETTMAPEVAEALRHSSPLGPVRTFRIRSNIRRHYDRLRETPAGVVAVGDSASAANPIYGQGMSVAALSARALGRAVVSCSASSPADLTRHANRAVAAASANAWQLALGEDVRVGCPTEGIRPQLSARFGEGYRNRLERAAALDPEIALVFNEVINLYRPVSALGSPGVMRRVLRPLRDRNPGPLSHTITTVLSAGIPA